MTKLTPAQENIIKSMAIDYADGFEWTTQYGTKVSRTIMLRTGLIEDRPVSGGYSWEKEYKLTDAGREYAIAQGWIDAPAASKPTTEAPRAVDLLKDFDEDSGVDGEGSARPCENCSGSGTAVYGGITFFCRVCGGTGIHTEPEENELDTLRAENARLRAALEAIANMKLTMTAGKREPLYVVGGNAMLLRVQQIAEQALNAK